MSCCALVAASDFNAQHFKQCLAEKRFDHVVAVDAGLAYLVSCSCKPDYFIGDCDSLSWTPEGADVELHHPDKDKSDLELSLDYVWKKQFDELVIYGALGKRLDHTLANIQVCTRFAEAGLKITFIDIEGALYILTGPGEFVIPAREGIVSVFSAVDVAQGVTEKGMKYSLDHAELNNRTSLGLSNELTGGEARISVEAGTLFIFYPLALPEH